jgi:hypothetical protein
MKRDGVPGVTASPTSLVTEHGTNFEKALRRTSRRFSSVGTQ